MKMNFMSKKTEPKLSSEQTSGNDAAAKAYNMMQSLPMNVLVCDAETLTINYANPASVEVLRTMEDLLPSGVNADNIVGQCIDVFHKHPEHQRQMLRDPGNLPHTALIRLAAEILELNVVGLFDEQGNFTDLMLTWAIVTEREQLKRMVDVMPLNVMMADPKSLEITYVNQTSIETLKPLASLLPVPPEKLMGTCIDVFHKNPSHQRNILGDPNNLPFSSKIPLGDETLSLDVAAIQDEGGYYMGAMLTWSVVTAQVALANKVSEVTDTVASSSTEFQATSESLAATAEQTSSQASLVATATEQLSSSIQEISQQVTRSADIASVAVKDAERSNEMVQGLADAAEKIGQIIDLIKDVADQTNLLALNATIEAARAGDAGKGFAVVAAEVKNLANQTGKATEEISAQVSSIQGATQDTVGAIQGIGKTINEISEIATAISSAVEEQGAATTEVAGNIAGVQTAATETGESSGVLREASAELAGHAENLKAEITAFMDS